MFIEDYGWSITLDWDEATTEPLANLLNKKYQERVLSKIQGGGSNDLCLKYKGATIFTINIYNYKYSSESYHHSVKEFSGKILQQSMFETLALLILENVVRPYNQWQKVGLKEMEAEFIKETSC